MEAGATVDPHGVGLHTLGGWTRIGIMSRKQNYYLYRSSCRGLGKSRSAPPPQPPWTETDVELKTRKQNYYLCLAAPMLSAVVARLPDSVLDSIRGQYSGHVITLDQSEASVFFLDLRLILCSQKIFYAPTTVRPKPKLNYPGGFLYMPWKSTILTVYLINTASGTHLGDIHKLRHTPETDK